MFLSVFPIANINPIKNTIDIAIDSLKFHLFSERDILGDPVINGSTLFKWILKK
jgi:hypothetical protein